MKRQSGSILLLIFFILIIFSLSAAFADIPNKALIGYWHNWQYPNPTPLLLDEIPMAYDVIDVAFATPTEPLGTNMQFAPDPGMYPDPQDFIDDVQYLQSLGKTVLISIGGATAPIHFDDSTNVQEFIDSMSDIIDTYEFDGMDIDLEAGSLFLDPGDNDYRYPTTPNIVYLIQAVKGLIDLYRDDFILTMAPETAYVQGAYFTYAGVYGAYLPLLHAVRDELTIIYVQHYNTGSMYGSDGNIYYPPTADFHVAMADMLLGGFIVDFYGEHILFDPLSQDQVAIGLPACTDAASSGYTTPDVVHEALNYIVLGESFGGQYQLVNPAGYPDFRGLMTWSINWDVYADYSFSDAHRAYLDSLNPYSIDVSHQQPVAQLTIFPNPVRKSCTISYSLPLPEPIELALYNCKGQLLYTKDGKTSTTDNNLTINDLALPNGIYFMKLSSPHFHVVEKFVVVN